MICLYTFRSLVEQLKKLQAIITSSSQNSHGRTKVGTCIMVRNYVCTYIINILKGNGLWEKRFYASLINAFIRFT